MLTVLLALTHARAQPATQPVLAWDAPHARVGVTGTLALDAPRATIALGDVEVTLARTPQPHVVLARAGVPFADAPLPDLDAERAFLLDARYVPGGALVDLRLGDARPFDDVFLPGATPAAGAVALDGAALRDPALAAQQRLDEPFPEPRTYALLDDVPFGPAAEREQTADLRLADVPRPAARALLTIELRRDDDAGGRFDRAAAERAFGGEAARGVVYLYGPDRQRYELARFFAPQARGRATFVADVTPFLPLLTGTRRAAVRLEGGAATWRVDARLDVYGGRPEREPVAVVNLWQGESDLSPGEHFYDDKTVPVPAGVRSAEVRLTVTGHGAAEREPSDRALLVNDDLGRPRLDTLWDADAFNTFDEEVEPRAGWTPGRLARTWVVPLDRLPRGELDLRYRPEPRATANVAATATQPMGTHRVDGIVVFYK